MCRSVQYSIKIITFQGAFVFLFYIVLNAQVRKRWLTKLGLQNPTTQQIRPPKPGPLLRLPLSIPLLPAKHELYRNSTM